LDLTVTQDGDRSRVRVRCDPCATLPIWLVGGGLSRNF